MSTTLRAAQRWHLFTLCLIGGCAASAGRSVADELRTSQASDATSQEQLTARRDELWKAAKEASAKQDWQAAIRSGKAAFVLQSRQLTDQPLVDCQMLEALSFWHTRAREFPSALAAARELLERRCMLFSEDYWQTVDARLNVAIVERLSKLTQDEWEQFLKADRLNTEAVDLLKAGKNAAALEKAKESLPIYTGLLGRDNSLTLTALANVLTCHLALGQYSDARPLLKEVFELQPKIRGTFHPDTILSLKSLAWFNEAVGGLADAEEGLRKIVDIQTTLNGPNHLDTIAARVELGKICTDRKNLTEAEQLIVPALELQQAAFGDENLATAQTMKVLGALRLEQKKYAEAEKLLAKSVEVFSKLAGEDHLATASAYNALGKLHTTTNHLEQADEDFRLSMTICLDKLGDQHPAICKVLDNMAQLFEIGANTGLARQVRLQCLRIAEQSFGEMNVRTADALENLGGTYSLMNDFLMAEPYLFRAREIRRKLLGEEDPKTARIVRQLAYAHLMNFDPNRAEPLFQEALKVVEKTQGPECAEASHIRGQLGLLYRLTSRFEEAEVEYRRALNIIVNEYGPDHYLTAVVKMGLAHTVLSRGDCQQACRLLDETFAVYDQGLKFNDPRWFEALGISGKAYLAAGNTEKASQLLERGLHVAKLRMEMAGAFESERQRLQQMTMMREILDLYLSLPLTLRTDGSGAYQHVLLWKGAIATRQWRDRKYKSEDTAPLIEELQQLCRRWASLNLHVPDASEREDWLTEIAKLKLRKDALEEQLAVYSGKLQSPQEEVRAVDLSKLLLPATALVDILQYTHTSFDKDGDTVRTHSSERYVAFVVRRYHDMQRIDLGDVEPIAEAVANWRKTRGFQPNKGKTDWAATLGKLLWPQLKPYVNDCDTLLISPDGVLSQLAWSVLPGRKPGTYLIEDFAIGMVPVPQLLAETDKPEQRTVSFGPGLPVLAIGDLPPDERRRKQPATDRGESLLLIGNVDYDAAANLAAGADVPSKPQGGRFNFAPLKGTAAEVQALEDRFKQQFSDGKLTLLDKTTATEEAFWREAPRHRWLHIATHGFFAPPIIKSALAAQAQDDPTARPGKGVSIFHVGFLNGLAFTGANVGATGGGDDGILTATELSVMDLSNVEVAVLSGCETGLGEIRDGEGSFGMQRALQVAGVGTTIGSLWTVSDAKTNLLMQRFYANLWDKKLSKLESLREAQLWLLRTGGDEKAVAPKRLSPHYWAAFTLSGDWR